MEEELSGRLFLGIPLDDEVRKKLKQNTWQSLSRYSKDKMTPTYNWHFTLAFLGQMPISKRDKLVEYLKDHNWGRSFNLGIKSYGAFPSMSEGRVLWVGVERGKNEISNLAEELRRKSDECEIDYDKKPFVPHLTLCRMKIPRNLSRLSEDYKLKKELIYKVDKFILYESLGGSQKYREVLEIPLHED